MYPFFPQEYRSMPGVADISDFSTSFHQESDGRYANEDDFKKI